MSTPRIAIVYHSGYGHTARLAREVAEGSGGTLLAVDEHGLLADDAWRQLDAADAIVFGSPTYMGTVSWQFKRFIDATSSVWMDQRWKDKLAAGFTNSASIMGDKDGTIAALFTLSQQLGMLWVGTGMMPANAKASTRDDVNALGSFAGLAAATPADASADELVPGDLRTARLFGERVAATARRLSAARG